jgi:hypothetical protein
VTVPQTAQVRFDEQVRGCHLLQNRRTQQWGNLLVSAQFTLRLQNAPRSEVEPPYASLGLSCQLRPVYLRVK